jgi:hypothetical protein
MKNKLLLIIILLMSALPITSVSAADMSNFGGDSLLLGRFASGPMKTLTDGLSGAAVMISGSKEDSPVRYTFPEPEYIDMVYVRVGPCSCRAAASLYYEDGTEEIITDIGYTPNYVQNLWFGLSENVHKRVVSFVFYKWSGTSNVQFLEIDMRRNALPPMVPDVPTGLTGDVASGKVTLRWNPVSLVDGYNLYYNDELVNDQLITGTSYTVDSVPDNATQSFQVTAVNGLGESPKSPPLLTIYDTISPIAPIGLVSTPISGGRTLLTWEPNTEPDLAGYNVYKNNLKANPSLVKQENYEIGNLNTNTTYEFAVTALDTSNNESPKSLPVTYYLDGSAPTGVELQGNLTDTTMQLSWSESTDTDLQGYRIYRNGQLIANLPPSVTSYTVNNLTPGYSYDFYVIAFDAINNMSPHSNVVTAVVEATPVLLTAPDGLIVFTANQGLIARWNHLKLNVTGYNIYVDGVKINDVPINNNSYLISSLENGQSYDIQVSAVSQGVESELSDVVVGMPSVTSPPFIDLGYELSDVSTGVGSWFGSIWLILAFAISIPVAFLLGRRVKELF